MSEFFLELFSEEIPPKLQKKAREDLLNKFKELFHRENIMFDKIYSSLSTPNRLVVYFKNVQEEVTKFPKEIKGPNINSSKDALEGFLKSNNTNIKSLYRRKSEKGEFYFFKSVKKKIKTIELLKSELPDLLSNIKWEKSMRWGDHNLYWGRPLKSILTLFGGKTVNFDFHHLRSSNFTYTDKDFELSKKSFNSFNSYLSYFRSQGIIVDQKIRQEKIKKELLKIAKKRNYSLSINLKLLDEVSNIVEKPKVILCKFDKKFLEMPKEVIVTTIEKYQKFFPAYDKNNILINSFFIVADCEDKKGLIKKGNENVVEARLTDAEYFWKHNKSQSMLKRVSDLKNISYFEGLGNYFNKAQRLKKLSSLLSDELLISKEKIELASIICKVDLLSDLVKEFPELQGTLGGYFAEAQGFDKEVCLSIREHYLPAGIQNKIPKNIYPVALSISDKIDTLVGFFGLNLMPSSSKDPYALRRLSIGLIKIIIENNISLKVKDIINHSCNIYSEQSINFDNKKIQNELSKFILERFKNYMKEKGIRSDIIESSTINYDLNKLLITYKKSDFLQKSIKKELGRDLVKNYKRAFKIIDSENEIIKENIQGSPDPAIFKNDFEKILYKKLNSIRKEITSIKLENDFNSQLFILCTVKKELNDFFDNVIVNESDESLKKNRLELLKLLCKTYDNYINFTKVEILE